jgi:sortase A
MTDAGKKKNRTLKLLERVFLVAGIIGIGIWIAAQVVPAISQDYEGWVLDREIAGGTVSVSKYLADRQHTIVAGVESWFGLTEPPQSPAVATTVPRPSPRPRGPTIGPNGLVGRVTIPRLQLSAIVREGTSSKTLSLAAGHIPGTALPGASGNVGIAGHRDTLFRGLKDIRDGDTIDVETLDGTFQYKVESTKIVSPKDVYVLNPGLNPELTLVTCYPFYYVGSAPDRFIVKARLQSQSASEPQILREVSLQAETQTPAAVPKRTDDGARERGTAESSNPERSSPERNPELSSGPKRIAFTVPVHHSRQLTPNLSLGITDADAAHGGVYGWMWLMPEKRTVWLRDRGVQDPLIFSTGNEGDRGELTITRIGEASVSGYVVMR